MDPQAPTVPASERPDGADDETTVIGPKEAVRILQKPSARLAVALAWTVLAAGGVLLNKEFIKELQSEVPPIVGTSSYDAQELFNKYFPAQPIQGALLMKSQVRTPFVEFANKSTCNMTPSYHVDIKGDVLVADIGWHNASALGDGCILKADLIEFLDNEINLLPILGLKPEQVKVLKALVASKAESLPDITRCPVSTGKLTSDWFKFMSSAEKSLKSQFSDYNSTVASFASIPGQNISIPFPVPPEIQKIIRQKGLPNITQANISISVPAGMFWQLFEHQFLADSATTSLAATITSARDGRTILPTGKTAKDLGHALQDIASEDTFPDMQIQANSMGLMLESIQKGISETMDLSSMTLPVAILILAVMVRNVRLVIITLVNLLACVGSAILLMLPLAKAFTTATVAPALMVAVALAMSIDYSLFLLTRFQKEISNGRPVADAVTIMLGTSGRIVLVSGLTLLLCFLMMLCLPVMFICTLGISAAVTVFFAVAAALTLTPVLLLTCPTFFSSTKRWGITREGCCCRCKAVSAREVHEANPQENGSGNSVVEVESPPEDANSESKKESCWSRFGNGVQKLACIVVLVLFAIAFPVAAFSLPKFAHSVGLVPMMPTTASATHTLLELQDAFGVGALFPTTLIVVPPEGATATEQNRSKWLSDSCDQLLEVAKVVNANRPGSLPPFTPAAFLGPMIIAGKCSKMATGTAQWSNVDRPYSATKVTISYQVDPFSTEGQQWIIQLRNALEAPAVKAVAEWQVYGVGPIQMDVANATFNKIPLLVALMMVTVFAVIGVSFKSLVAPVRAIVCLLWMLVITFGLAIFVFQDGWLDFLGCSQLGRRDTGAMSWMSPCISFSVVVGLGLDYDIFYSERVVEEWEQGKDEKEAAVEALAETANTISAAGVIMVVAFIALLFSATPTLNEISFLLIVGVLIDCFITTKVIIPCAMSLLGRYNFWPRKRHVKASQRSAHAGVTESTSVGGRSEMGQPFVP